MRLEIESDLAAQHLEPLVNQDNIPESDLSDAGSRLKQGVSAARGGDRVLARTLLTEVTDEDPANAEAWLWLASISEYPEELLGFLNNVLAVDPNNDRALQWKAATGSLLSKSYVQRGLAAMDDGNAEFAEECFNSAITNDPSSETAWFWKASLTRDDVERTECLGRVLKLDPDHADARKALNEMRDRQDAERFLAAQTAAVSGDWRTASAAIDQLLASDPDHLGGWTLRSHFSTTFGEKLAAFEHLLEIAPDNTWAQNGKEFLTNTAEAVRNQPALNEDASDVVMPLVETKDPDQNAELEMLSEPLEFAEPEIQSEPLELTEPPSDLEFSEAQEVRDPEVACQTSEEVAVDNPVEGLDPEPAIELSSNEAPASDDDDDHEPLASRLAAELAGQVTDERIHEFLTEEAVSLPAGFDSGPTTTTSSENVELTENDEFALVSPHENGQAVEVTDEPTVLFESETESDVDVVDSVEFLDEDETIETADCVQAAATEDINAELATYNDVAETSNDDLAAIFADTDTEAGDELVVVAVSCPYCSAPNDTQAFQCVDCRAVLSMSDIDSLLGDRACDREALLQAVTQMEAEWNLREFDAAELTTLGLGYFNLKNPERGLAYLQEASRLDPNDVILAGQVNALAIRMDELCRQNENHESMPKGKTILVVDDSPTVRKLISSKLEKSGHKVVTAVDGVEAIELLDDLVPDLVLLDIAMPRMDGYSVCKLIRANEAVKSVPVVMISGKDGFFDKVRGRMAGTTGYVTKPFGPETLMRALETYLLPDVHVAESDVVVAE